MKHTKASWFAVDYAGQWAIQSGPYYGDPDLLRVDEEDGVDEETAKANSLLAVNAPAMLEALKESVNMLEHVHSKNLGVKHLGFSVKFMIKLNNWKSLLNEIES